VAAEKNARGNEELRQVVSGLGTYYDTDRRKYAHFVDGGITDNLGLRAIYEVIEMVGGIEAFLRKTNRRPPSHAVMISVNASTDPEPEMDLSNVQPSIAETVNAMSDIQIHRYNAATLELMSNTLRRWAKALSTPSRKVMPHFIKVDFRALEDPETRRFFNRVPTSFNLTDEQVDRLILAGRELLRANPEFQRFLAELKKYR
jgi:NTE family protein